MPAWQPWAALAGFAFLLHFAWEILQVPFFEDMKEAEHWRATLFCLRATVGDVAVTLGAYGIVTLAARDRQWIGRPTALPLLAFVLLGLAWTVGMERLATEAWSRWQYSEEMPMVGAVGLLPLLQWVLLPPLGLWLARRHLGWGSYTRAPRQA